MQPSRRAAALLILAEAMKLSDEERATLADRLLEIVPEVPDAGVEEAWLKETRRRRAEWKAGSVKIEHRGSPSRSSLQPP
ncbi:MAG: addiction module protein [Deltaproteobacteria bacterium]